jgi:hypothetical protein
LALGDTERGAWLRSAGIKIWALKDTEDDAAAMTREGLGVKRAVRKSIHTHTLC